MILELQQRLEAATRAAVRTAFDVDLPSLSFQYPPKTSLGDLAITAPFDLARTLRKPPRQIAERLAQELAGIPGVRRAEVAGGGYVNLFLERGAFVRTLRAHLADPQPPRSEGGHVIVEHTSINPNKAAHIGHVRNAVLGDTFVNVLRARGRDVGVQNYIDDTGVQVADVVVGFVHLEGKTLDQVRALAEAPRFDYYCWDLYARVGDYYAADPANKKRQAEAFHQIEAGEGEIAAIAELVASHIVDCHLRTMERLGIRYDLLARESDILRLHFWDRAFELLKQSGAIRLESEGKHAGCWVLTMDRAADGEPAESVAEGEEAAPQVDENKIIVRSNGSVTYTGKDIAYQLWKLGRLDRDFRYRKHGTHADGRVLWSTTSGDGEPGAPRFGHAQTVYNVIDVGQSYPQRVVKAGVAALGHADAAANSHHLAYEKVVLSPATARALGYAVSEDETAVKVSGRKGLGVKADDLIDLLTTKAGAEIESRDPAREAASREATARAVATGALRYFLLKFGRSKIITFDMDEALAFTGETGPYVQNAVVRARGIFGKLEAEGHAVAALLEQTLDLDRLLDGEEGDEVWALLLLMARTEDVVDQALRTEETAIVARHAFAVAQAFHSYYQQSRYSVLRAESEELRAFRVMVVDAFVRQMAALTALLGIPVPERM